MANKRMPLSLRPTPNGKVAVVTGGTDGIGKEIARSLARSGTRIFLVGRNSEKGHRAAWELRAATLHDAIEFISADISRPEECRRLSVEIDRRTDRLHYLVHCAGVVRGRRELTAEGIESNFATNYLGRFALTGHLLPLLQASGEPGAAARIVIIGGAARKGTIYFDDVNLTDNFFVLRAVAQFCQANDVFTVELARRLATADVASHVTVTSLKVGVVKTNIRHEFPWWMKLMVPLFFDPWLTQSRQSVAESALRLLLDQQYEGLSGALFQHIRRFKQLTLDESVLDQATGKYFWELSESLSRTVWPSFNDSLVTAGR